MNDPLRFSGKRVIVTGCAAGIGRATAAMLIELGAKVHGFDRNSTDLPLASFSQIDLGDASAIDAVAFKGRLDALFNCVGLSPTQPAEKVIGVNFLGVRQLTERLLGHMDAGAAVVNVSSTGGSRWRERLPQLKAFVATASFSEGAAWLDENPAALTNPYAFSKEAVIVWTLQQSRTLIKRGIRINCTSPGAVQTEMLDDIEARFSAAAIDAIADPIGRRSSPAEQAWPLVFLGSEAAAYINGVDFAVDGGWAAAAMLADAGRG